MPSARARRRLNALAWLLAGIYTLDRLLKLLAVERCLRRPLPPAPVAWPSVSLLQPITHGASDLADALACRAALHYAGRLQHILICDAGDAQGIALCEAWRARQPALEIIIVTVTPEVAQDRGARPGGETGQAAVSTKIEKLHAGLPQADGAVLAFVDDDILLRPDAVAGLVRHLQPHLQSPRAGSAFGLAVYTDWRNVPSGLLSAFVNANALLAYLPLTYLVAPFTITGHFYALRREVFDAIGGLDGMAGRFDDDHELARRVQAHGLQNVQTPVLYDVDNHLATLNDYANQMRRWPLVLLSALIAPVQTLAALLHGDTFWWRGRRIRLQRGGQYTVIR